MWRQDVDESGYSDIELLAWHWVLPFKCLPIIDSDRVGVKKTIEKLSETFTKRQISSAVKRLNLRAAK